MWNGNIPNCMLQSSIILVEMYITIHKQRMEYYQSGSPFTCHNEPWSSFRPVVSCDGDFQVHARQQHASTKVKCLLLFCNCILLSSSMYAQSFYFHYWKLAKNLAPVPLTSLIWVISLIFFVLAQLQEVEKIFISNQHGVVSQSPEPGFCRNVRLVECGWKGGTFRRKKPLECFVG